ncbi:MAG TPA: indole-3-glycerol phosphate synthase TrpC [Kiritimatiellia bacterium]|nr:indole-3-glycerol phosphate synthase TrpC [Kiritimatiellia bacterium]
MSRDWLAEIVQNKRGEIAERIAAVSVANLKAACAKVQDRPDFMSAVTGGRMGLIAEVKRRSPSAGAIREPFDPAAIARAYEAAGAQAVSVLMDRVYFGGGEEDFQMVRAAIGLPMLYKEFVVDPWQIWHAASLGASAILLIAGVLNEEELRDMMEVCKEAGLAPLVEVHDELELNLALAAGAPCIGINNRNLKTFVTTLDTTYTLFKKVPAGCPVISESGIRTAEDVVGLQAAGIKGVLVGEHLLRQSDPGEAVNVLMGSAWACS